MVEIIIDSVAGCEHHSGIVEQVDALLAEFFCREPLYLKKGMEDTLYAKFLFNVIIRRLVACRLRLRNEYFLYHRIL